MDGFSIDPSFDNEIKMIVPGWKSLIIEYSTEIVDGISYLCWRIKGTEHVFRIQTAIVYQNHGINFEEHFRVTLIKFREDYIQWKNEDFTLDWMKRYERIFKNYIIII